MQTLPQHDQEQAYPHELLGASPQYVMHNVHDVPFYDGHSHLTILRTSDGSTAWSDLDASTDARAQSLAGRYYVEKVGQSTYWPDSVRFFDIETHTLAGAIAVPDAETLFAIGPGWTLTSRPGGESFPGNYLVIRRLDGSSVELPSVEIDAIPRYSGTDGTFAWLHDGYNGPLYQVDVAAGTATVVPQPTGAAWSSVLVGPTDFFNIVDNYNGHVTVTAIDRTSSASTVTDLVTGLTGNVPTFVPLGTGLGAFQPAGQVAGTLWKVDLANGTLGAAAGHLSDMEPMGPGTVAMVVAEKAPGTIAIDAGDGPVGLVDLPRVAEMAATMSYDRTLRARWGDDTTWSIDPADASPAWLQTDWTTHQRVTTSGAVTLVNDLDDSFSPTNRWHLSWPGGQRDLNGSGLVLGHGGELLVRRSPADVSTYQVERVRTGEMVATADSRGAVADGSWVWTWSSTNVLQGVDVDHTDTPARTVPVEVGGAGSPAIADVRGRWALLARGGYTVIDTLGVVAPYILTGAANNTGGSPSVPALGNGFAVWSRWTYNADHHINGKVATVADLSPAHVSRELVDPGSGATPTVYDVDEAGSASLAYLDASQQPKIVRLPWITEAPTFTDSAAPTLSDTDAPAALVGSGIPVSRHFGWTFSDGAPSSGIASYSVRSRVRAVPGTFGTWTVSTSAAGASLDLLVDPGHEVCAQASATDVAGNASAWSAERCSRIDGTAPVLRSATGSARFTAPDSSGGITYAYSATDAEGVASYDVQVRSASSGGDLGAWTTVRAGTTATSVRQTTTAGTERCFRFRARDLASNVSAWSAGRCSSVAIQDRLLAHSRHAFTRSTSKALDGSYTLLDRKGAWVRTRVAVPGRTLALWVIAGPNQGKVAVYVGGLRVASLPTTAARVQRRLVLVSLHRGGVVELVQAGRRSVRVDALAVER